MEQLAAKENAPCIARAAGPNSRLRNLLFIENGVGADRPGSRSATREIALRYDSGRRGELFTAMSRGIR